MAEIAVSLVAKLYISGEKCMLPSAVQGCVWSSFHKLRNSDSINQVWTAFMTVLKAPEPCRVESQACPAVADGQGSQKDAQEQS